MSMHPNVILMIILTPDGLARKTMREILGKDYSADDCPDVKIGEQDYHPIVMETDYDEDMQISAKEGDLVFYDLITYGYGEVVGWADLEKMKKKLEEWGNGMCKKHNCSMRIEVTANHW